MSAISTRQWVIIGMGVMGLWFGATIAGGGYPPVPVALFFIWLIVVGARWLDADKRREQAQMAGPVQQWGSGVGPPPGQYGSVIPASGLPPVLTRTYAGKPNEVEVLRAADAEALEGRGYFPSSQSYIEGRWSRGAWVMAFLALTFLLGILILAYMIAVKPAGTLTVIYERRLRSRAVSSAAAVPASPPPPQVIDAATAAGTGVPGGGKPLEAPAGVIRLGQWEVIGSASEDFSSSSRVFVNVDAGIVGVLGASISVGIPLKDAVAEIEDGRLCLSKGSVRQFVLVPDDQQDLGRALGAIRERQAPEQRREPSVPPAVVATPAILAPPPVPDSPALPHASDSPAERIEARLATLDRLRATGAISEDEYQSRRNKILDEV